MNQNHSVLSCSDEGLLCQKYFHTCLNEKIDVNIQTSNFDRDDNDC